MSIKDVGKRRILEQMVDRVRHASARQSNDDNPYGASGGGGATQRYCAMIVDDASLRVLSSCCKVYDILEEGVTVVESILKKRQPLPDLDSIYFITPEMSSVEALCRDFANEKQPQYKSVHLFFTTPIPPKSGIMEAIARCTGLLSRLQTCIEFNLGFISYERRVFHFDMPDVIPKLFPPSRPEILQEIADKLLSVCVSLGDKPNIRFHSNAFRLNEQLASILHQKLTKLDIPGLTRGKTNLLIVDRSIDLPPLFLHEYTYQACVYDLFDVPVCTPIGQEPKGDNPDGPLADDTIQYAIVTNEGKHEKRVALLSESDDVYAKYRHVHVLVALKKIPEDIKRFLNENAAAKLSKKKDMSNEEMQRAIRDLPEYQEMLAKLSAHHNISQRCIQELNRQGINKLGPLEMDLATGVEASGKEVSSKKNLSTLGALLSDSAIGMEEKLRLLLLYFSMTDGVKEDDRRKMMEAAQLPLENSMCVHSFMKLGFDEALPSDAPQPAAHTHKLHRDKERRSIFANRAKNVEMALSRFQPYIKDIMEKGVQGGLHGGRFPYVAQVDAHRGAFTEPEPRTTAAHVRARDKDWDFGGETGTSTPRTTRNIGGESLQVLNLPDTGTPPLVVFVLGGVAMSEMRSAYEVSRQLGCEVFIGGTHILTPRNFLNSLKRNAPAGTQFWAPQ